MTIAQDATFLTNVTNVSSNLHHQHLLQVQCDELLASSLLWTSTTTTGGLSKKVKQWKEKLTSALILDDDDDDDTLISLEWEDDAVLKTAANANVLPTYTAFVVIKVPPTVDYRNHGYLAHRQAILHDVIAKRLKASIKSNDAVQMHWRHQTTRKTAILLTIQNKFRILIDVRNSNIDGWIPPIRSCPNRSNLSRRKQSIWYNHALHEDMSWIDFDKELFGQQQHAKACLGLLQIWALQRGIWRSILNVTDASAILLYLIRTKRTNARMSPIQVLTHVWKFFVSSDTTDGCCHVIPHVDSSESQTIADCSLAKLYAQLTRDSPLTDHDDPQTLVQLWQKTVDLALLDPTMRHNYTNYSSSDVMTLRILAEESIGVLQQQNNAFRTLFLTRDRFYSRYDVYLTVNVADCSMVVLDENEVDPFDRPRALQHQIFTKLRQALGDRVLEIRFLSSGNGDTNRAVTCTQDSDEIPTYEMTKFPQKCQPPNMAKPQHLIIGFNVAADSHFRMVDRGPPMTDEAAVAAFRHLWGDRAELRRFKDGAIVYAVVWEKGQQPVGSSYSFANEHHWQAGIVQAIARHVLQTHFWVKRDEKKKDSSGGGDLGDDSPMSRPGLDDMVSLVDGILTASDTASSSIGALINNPVEAHRAILKSFEEFATLLRSKTAKTIPDGKNKDLRSQLGLPLAIDAVEALDPCLRHSSVYPPIPHPLLGGQRAAQSKKVAGAISFDPIRIQIRFAVSTKWPTELKAIQAAERAMLIELANGLDKLNAIPHKSVVTEKYADICFQGYVWRVNIRADPEINYLRGLNSPTMEARKLLADFLVSHVAAPKHHTLVNSIFTKNPSSSAVVRLAKRWLSAHMLLIPFEAIELMVCHVYCTANPPGTVTRGFERWLHLLATYDWLQEALIVDPQGHLSDDDVAAIETQFKTLRGRNLEDGPPMCIFSPSNKPDMEPVGWVPSFVDAKNPEKVILCRAVALARRSHTFLMDLLVSQVSKCAVKHKKNWTSLFLETSDALRSFSALLRLHSDFVSNPDASSTAKTLWLSKTGNDGSAPAMTSFSRSMNALADGPKALRRTMYKNLISNQPKELLLNWQPVRSAMAVLQSTGLTEHALFLYNDLCPEVIAIVWRKHDRRPFSAVTSEYVQPISADNWKSETLVVLNVQDILRGATGVMADMISGVKIFDNGPTIEPAAQAKPPLATNNDKGKRRRAVDDKEEEEADSSSEQSDSPSVENHND